LFEGFCSPNQNRYPSHSSEELKKDSSLRTKRRTLGKISREMLLLLLLTTMLPLALSSISCLQCSSLYELDCANPVASQRFHYPCLDSWASTSCLIVEDRGILVRNCSKVRYKDGCHYRGQTKICSCSQSQCNSAPAEKRNLGIVLFLFFIPMLF